MLVFPARAKGRGDPARVSLSHVRRTRYAREYVPWLGGSADLRVDPQEVPLPRGGPPSTDVAVSGGPIDRRTPAETNPHPPPSLEKRFYECLKKYYCKLMLSKGYVAEDAGALCLARGLAASHASRCNCSRQHRRTMDWHWPCARYGASRVYVCASSAEFGARVGASVIRYRKLASGASLAASVMRSCFMRRVDEPL